MSLEGFEACANSCQAESLCGAGHLHTMQNVAYYSALGPAGE
jgi:hypothetical protein